MTISYVIGNKLYMNITNKCPCACTFCIRNNADGAYDSDPLWLEHEPTIDEIKTNIDTHNLSSYDEIVFCGYGEPTSKLTELLETAEYMKLHKNCPPIRLNTNGLSNLINNISTASMLCNIFDIISISLNAGTKDEYMSVTRPKFLDAFESLQTFTLDCVKSGKSRIIMTVVDVISECEIESARKLCEKLGADFRVRSYDS